MNERFGLSLSATFAYDFPTIRRMRQRVEELVSQIEGPATSVLESSSVMGTRPLSRRRAPPAVVASTAPARIVGSAVRLANMCLPRQVMEALERGHDLVTVVPSERWDWQDVFDENNGKHRSVSKWGCFLEKEDAFDAEFFGLSAREATVMDPQHRMLLETGWESMERSGKTAAELAGTNLGVFVGMYASDYYNRSIQQPERSHVNLGNMNSAACGRVSYFFDLTGECVSIDTACSSSLVAMIQCCRLGVGGFVFGVQSILDPHITVNFSQARMLSADGRCKTFDSRANGYVSGKSQHEMELRVFFFFFFFFFFVHFHSFRFERKVVLLC